MGRAFLAEEVRLGRGRTTASQAYCRFVELWKDDFPALQPAVRDTRVRLGRLATEGGTRAPRLPAWTTADCWPRSSPSTRPVTPATSRSRTSSPIISTVQ